MFSIKKSFHLSILVYLILISACSTPSTSIATRNLLPTPTLAPCNIGAAGRLIKKELAIFQEFKTQVELIVRTPGINLPGALEKLKEIRTKADKLKANPCAGKLYQILVEGMNQDIEQAGGLLTDSTTTAREQLAGLMETQFLQLSDEVTRLFQCLPNC